MVSTTEGETTTQQHANCGDVNPGRQGAEQVGNNLAAGNQQRQTTELIAEDLGAANLTRETPEQAQLNMSTESTTRRQEQHNNRSAVVNRSAAQLPANLQNIIQPRNAKGECRGG